MSLGGLCSIRFGLCWGKCYSSRCGVSTAQGQAADVRKTIEAEDPCTWAAVFEDISRGFVPALLVREAEMGEMDETVMLAVDPSHQRQGLATALTEAATVWLRDQRAAEWSRALRVSCRSR